MLRTSTPVQVTVLDPQECPSFLTLRQEYTLPSRTRPTNVQDFDTVTWSSLDNAVSRSGPIGAAPWTTNPSAHPIPPSEMKLSPSYDGVAASQSLPLTQSCVTKRVQEQNTHGTRPVAPENKNDVTGESPKPRLKAFRDEDGTTVHKAEIARHIRQQAPSESTFCSHTLRLAFRTCPRNNFPSLACSISCVLGSKEQLSVSALCEAVNLYLEHTDRLAAHKGVKEFGCWLRTFGDLFTIQESALVIFALPSMKTFLTSFPIQGIDSSQKTIAMLCLAQVELDCGNNPTIDDAGDLSEFSAYASANWKQHQRIARKSSISLNLRGFRTRNTDSVESRMRPASVYAHRRSTQQYLSRLRPEAKTHMTSLEDEWEIVEYPDSDMG